MAVTSCNVAPNNTVIHDTCTIKTCLLPPGEGVVQMPFEVRENKKPVPVAGTRCTTGQMHRSKNFRLIRNEEVIYDGEYCGILEHWESESFTCISYKTI